jgi:small subunit ribosomal protein S17
MSDQTDIPAAETAEAPEALNAGTSETPEGAPEPAAAEEPKQAAPKPRRSARSAAAEAQPEAPAEPETPAPEPAQPQAAAEPEQPEAAAPAPVDKPAKPEEKQPAPEPAGPETVDFGAPKSAVRGRRKVRMGKVVSTKMMNTVVVAVESTVRHALYGKTIRRTTKFKAHDDRSVCGEGDTVEIMETRPISREKRWRVVRVVEKAK